ncbi:hypothetical protein B0T21DRAFT_276603, partial [Apiosordaria backusii]
AQWHFQSTGPLATDCNMSTTVSQPARPSRCTVAFVIPPEGRFSSRPPAIRAAPPHLFAHDRSLGSALLGPYLQTSSPSFFIPHCEDTLRGEAQIPDLA